MGDVVEKMGDYVPETFFRFNIFLPAHLAIMPCCYSITIKAGIFSSLFKMGHG